MVNTRLSETNPVETIPITEVVEWTKESSGSRLFLPPIQRSMVWRNSQIINYWDSLLRGYPAGLMMVHRPKKGGACLAVTSDGNTCPLQAGDFQLFDGQQRLTAILLGLGEGQLKDRLKLWVDLGSKPPDGADLQFVLRISSTGQPFGYQPQSPNEKLLLQKRRDMATEWVNQTKSDRFDSGRVFKEAGGNYLIDAACAVPLKEITDLVHRHEAAGVVTALHKSYPKIPTDHLETFVSALIRALNTPIVFQLIKQDVINDEGEYIRFFGRLGQGGTALTNDELTYSIIKHHFPQVRERMKEITDGEAGRVASEVNLVLAALRVAKVSAPGKDPDSWQTYGRPHPGNVSRLRELPGVRKQFECMITESGGGRLKDLLESIRRRLVYRKESDSEGPQNLSGLPVILLARLPHQLVDVLILMESHRQQQENHTHTLPAFVLYWLLFVGDSEKAANIIFRRYCLKEADWQPNIDKNLIRLFEDEGVSHRLPSLELLDAARKEILSGTHLLRAWGERFAILDANKEHPTADALRVFSTNDEIIKRALLWLQRQYLTEQFRNYDPTSSRDEDLPIDKDHLIPHKKFGDHWRRQQNCLFYSVSDEKNNFYEQRWTVGNSLGNFRWLDASHNRRRQDGPIDPLDGERDFIKDVKEWNDLRDKNPWSEADVASFQKMIDLRTLDIYKALLDQGGLEAFVSVADSELRSTKA